MSMKNSLKENTPYPFVEHLNKNQNVVWDYSIKNYNSALYNAFKIAGFSDNIILKAKDQYLHLSNNKKILDATSGFGVVFWGHNPVNAVKIEKLYRENNLINYSKTHPTIAQSALIHNLKTTFPLHLNNYYFGVTGAEGVEASIKLSLSYNKNSKGILVASEGYHGKTLKTLPLTSFQKWRSVFTNENKNLEFFKFGDIESLKNAKKKLDDKGVKLNCIITETIQGGSQRTASNTFHQELQNLALKNNALTIYDEIKVGLLRTGKLLAFQNYKNIKPDIVIVSKPLGMGLHPISIVASSQKIFNKAYASIQDGSIHSSTFSGLGASMAIASQYIYEASQKDTILKINKLSQQLENVLNNLQSQFPKRIKKITGIGLFRGLELNFSIISNQLGLDMKKIPVSFASLYTLAAVRFLYKNGILTYFSPTEPEVLHIEPNIKFTENDFKLLEHNLFLFFKSNQTKNMLKIVNDVLKYKIRLLK